MPIQLTTAISGGDFESGSLTHAKINFFAISVQNQVINFRVQLGRIVEDQFQAAQLLHSGTVRDFEITGEDYSTIVAATASAQGAILYDEFAAALYQWLLDNSHFVGSIV